jgi:hypothetical protein
MVSYFQLGLFAVLVLILVDWYRKSRSKDTFVSAQAREVHARAERLFAENGGKLTYSQYKAGIPGADPVQYADVAKLQKEGKLTPQAVEEAL